MSQIRKIKRKQSKNQPMPDKGKKALLWMVVLAVVLVLVVAFLGFRNVSNAPAPNTTGEASQQNQQQATLVEDPMLITSEGDQQLFSELLTRGEEGTAVVFFLGAG